VAFYYPLNSWPALQTVPWSAKYVFDDDVIRYVSIENKKKELVSSVDATVGISGNTISSNEVAGIKYESGPSILVHTSVPFGIEFKDTDEKVVYQTVLDHLNTVLPNLGILNNMHYFILI
jgi:renalase